MTTFSSLFSPLRVGPVELDNRVVMLPMGLKFADQGRPTERDVAFYDARAAARPGMIIVGGMGVHETTQVRAGVLLAPYDTRYIGDFRAIAHAVRSHGVKLVGQLLHLGREGVGDPTRPLLAPSVVPSTTTAQVPRALTPSEIREIVASFRASSHNLAQAGFDGFELHAAHGYLGAQFLSPASNTRTDSYGGVLEDRARFVIEVAEAVRDECGRDLVLGIRVSAPEAGSPLDAAYEVEPVVAHLSRTGLFDYVSVAVGVSGRYVKDMSYPEGAAVDACRAVKQATSLPVLASQRIVDPAMAEEIVASGAADMVGLGRALLADPAWTAWARAGEPERIIPCVATLQDCRSGNSAIGCMNNPLTGRERELGPIGASDVAGEGHVVVVGGGPAGLEASRVAAARGLRVTLFERDAEVGGQVRFAALAPTRGTLRKVVSQRLRELRRSGVDVRTGIEATRETVLEAEPDTVILCTGAVPGEPPFAVAGSPVIESWSTVWRSPLADGGSMSVAVLDDGTTGWESVNIAEFLASRGHSVTIVASTSGVNPRLPVESRGDALARLRALGVRFEDASVVTAVHGTSLTIADSGAASRARPSREPLEADAVVVAGNKRPDDRLWREFDGVVPQVLLAGDCVTPRQISEALFEGHKTGRAAGVAVRKSVGA